MLPRPIRTIGLLLLLLQPGGVFPNNGSAAAPHFTLSPLLQNAYRAVLDLRLNDARNALADLKKQDPDNLLALLVENYLETVTVFVNDDPAEYARLARGMDARLARIARGPRKSPWYLYAQAEIRLQWAMLHGRYGQYLTGLSDVKQAYALLEQNRKEHPEFAANLKSLGMLHVLVDNIPEEYRWGVKALSGMRGSTEQGLEELQTALEYAKKNDFLFEEEVRTTYAFLLLNLRNDRPKAWEVLTSGRLNAKKSPLAAYTLASVAMRTGRNDEAIRILESCPEGGPYHAFPYRHFLLGIARLNRLDPDARQALETFVHTCRGQSGIKEAYQKMAWSHLVAGRERDYRRALQQVKSEGSDRAETDKAALREATSGEMPDARLLRARLLFDGGYYQRAYDTLQAAAGAYAGAGKNSVEYAYRLGRIAHELDRFDEAVRAYQQALDSGAAQPWYFACNAALQLGLLYEQKGNREKAREAFRRCLALQPEEYAASLHARAKAGLERL